MCIKIYTYINWRVSLMVKMLCYGHGDTSSNLVRVMVAIYNCKEYRRFKTIALIAQR